MNELMERYKNRENQLKEMEKIWNKSNERTQGYLEGCMVTAFALAGFIPNEPDGKAS